LELAQVVAGLPRALAGVPGQHRRRRALVVVQIVVHRHPQRVRERLHGARVDPPRQVGGLIGGGLAGGGVVRTGLALDHVQRYLCRENYADGILHPLYRETPMTTSTTQAATTEPVRERL